MALTPLRLAAAHYVLGISEAREWVDAAHAALNDATYTPDLVSLVIHPAPDPAACLPHFLSALEELGIPLPAPEAAVLTVIDHHLVRFVEELASFSDVVYSLLEVEESMASHPVLKQSPELLSPLRPYTRFWAMIEEYVAGRIWPDSLGRPGARPEDERDENFARWTSELGALAREWCRARWGPRLPPPWHTATVTTLASGIAAEGAFERLPILADALQDAGCEDEGVLEHLRGKGPHTHCCFLIDLLRQ